MFLKVDQLKKVQLISFTARKFIQYILDLDTSLVYSSVKGYPKPRIKWYRNGQPLQDGAPSIVFLDHGLLISNFRQELTGTYDCKADNNLGHIESDPVELSLKCRFTFIIKVLYILRL